MKTAPTTADYLRAFQTESSQEYPAITDLENEFGFALPRDKLEEAARLLACPVKVNSPNWQHGRVIYAVLRNYIAKVLAEPRIIRSLPSVNCLDIGTAKGFSALCARWAINDANLLGKVTSIDVIDPLARQDRNTVADFPTVRTLPEILEPWPEAKQIEFKQATGVNWLSMNRKPLDFVFVDGKHNYAAVSEEIKLSRTCQVPGAITLFDDVQVPQVKKAVEMMTEGYYDVRWIKLKEGRGYALATAVG